jgi:hypothetical protein
VAVPVYNSHAKGYNCWLVVGLFECDYTANCLAEKVEKGGMKRAEDAHESSCPDLEADMCRGETHDIWERKIEKGFYKCRWGGPNQEDEGTAPPHQEVEAVPEQEGQVLEPLRNQNPD